MKINIAKRNEKYFVHIEENNHLSFVSAITLSDAFNTQGFGKLLYPDVGKCFGPGQHRITIEKDNNQSAWNAHIIFVKSKTLMVDLNKLSEYIQKEVKTQHPEELFYNTLKEFNIEVSNENQWSLNLVRQVITYHCMSNVNVKLCHLMIGE